MTESIDMGLFRLTITGAEYKFTLVDSFGAQPIRLLFPSTYRDAGQAVIVYAFKHRRPTFDHEGLDLRAPMLTPVVACAAGVIEKVRDGGDYGKYIKIKHDIGGKTYYTYYAHLSVVSVTVGLSVAPGQGIGLSGDTGNSTAPHLHLTLVEAGNTTRLRGVSIAGCIDPEPYLYTADGAKITVVHR